MVSAKNSKIPLLEKNKILGKLNESLHVKFSLSYDHRNILWKPKYTNNLLKITKSFGNANFQVTNTISIWYCLNLLYFIFLHSNNLPLLV